MKKINIISAFAIMIIFLGCSDQGLLASLEDQRKVINGTLPNRLFAHSLVLLNGKYYVGGTHLWSRSTSSGSTWRKSSAAPSGVDFIKTPVVSVETDGTSLFVATSSKVYVGRSANNPSSSNYLFGALKSANNQVYVTDADGKNWHYSGGSWTSVFSSELKSVAHDGTNYYFGVGNTVKTGTNEDGSGTTDISPDFSGLQDITTTGTANEVYVLANNKVYFSDDGGITWGAGYGSGSYYSIIYVDGRLLISEKSEGYHVLNGTSLKTNKSSDGFTNDESLVYSPDSLPIDQTGAWGFFYDGINNRLFGFAYGSRGLFSAKKSVSDGLWAWEIE